MTLPAFIQVGPIRYSLKIDQAALDHTGTGKSGSTLHNSQAILLCDNEGPDQQADTVLHETLHAILAQTYGELSVDEDERIISALSPLLLDTLRRNPDLVAYLVGESHP